MYFSMILLPKGPVIYYDRGMRIFFQNNWFNSSPPPAPVFILRSPLAPKKSMSSSELLENLLHPEFFYDLVLKIFNIIYYSGRKIHILVVQCGVQFMSINTYTPSTFYNHCPCGQSSTNFTLGIFSEKSPPPGTNPQLFFRLKVKFHTEKAILSIYTI